MILRTAAGILLPVKIPVCFEAGGCPGCLHLSGEIFGLSAHVRGDPWLICTCPGRVPGLSAHVRGDPWLVCTCPGWVVGLSAPVRDGALAVCICLGQVPGSSAPVWGEAVSGISPVRGGTVPDTHRHREIFELFLYAFFCCHLLEWFFWHVVVRRHMTDTPT